MQAIVINSLEIVLDLGECIYLAGNYNQAKMFNQLLPMSLGCPLCVFLLLILLYTAWQFYPGREPELIKMSYILSFAPTSCLLLAPSIGKIWASLLLFNGSHAESAAALGAIIAAAIFTGLALVLFSLVVIYYVDEKRPF